MCDKCREADKQWLRTEGEERFDAGYLRAAASTETTSVERPNGELAGSQAKTGEREQALD